MRSHLRKIAVGLFTLVLLVFTFLYFLNTTRHDWIYTGDSLNSVVGHAFQYSGFARGEYPIWNPLIRAGDSGIVFQMIGMASPIYNIVTLASVLLHNTDVVLCHAIYIYLMIVLYAIGMFLLVSALAKAGIAAGSDGLIIEVHSHPEDALSDGAQSLLPENFSNLVKDLKLLSQAVGREI